MNTALVLACMITAAQSPSHRAELKDAKSSCVCEHTEKMKATCGKHHFHIEVDDEFRTIVVQEEL